jgi:hypothetical protein
MTVSWLRRNALRDLGSAVSRLPQFTAEVDAVTPTASSAADWPAASRWLVADIHLERRHLPGFSGARAASRAALGADGASWTLTF